MNFVFINTEFNYDIVYRHDAYGIDNPTFEDVINWVIPHSAMLNKVDWNTHIAIF